MPPCHYSRKRSDCWRGLTGKPNSNACPIRIGRCGRSQPAPNGITPALGIGPLKPYLLHPPSPIARMLGTRPARRNWKTPNNRTHLRTRVTSLRRRAPMATEGRAFWASEPLAPVQPLGHSRPGAKHLRANIRFAASIYSSFMAQSNFCSTCARWYRSRFCAYKSLFLVRRFAAQEHPASPRA